MSHIMRQSSMDTQNESMKYSKSLTKEARKREMQKITAENSSILRRIQHAEPTYDHMAWQEDARRHEGYMKNMCELPVVIGPLSAEQEARRSLAAEEPGMASRQQIEYE